MPIQRQFLGGDQPALVVAAEHLLRKYTQGRQARLGGVLAVLPTGVARRRLMEILVAQCEQRKLILEPPIICRLGTPQDYSHKQRAMPEYLYEIKKPLASELTQRLAWAQTLRTAPPSQLDHVAPHAPPAEDWEAWLELAMLIQRQHRELASDCLNFEGVLEQAKKLAGFDEEPRWHALQQVQQRYLRLLDSLEVWDIQTARLFAIEHELVRTERDIVLIGVADMNLAMRKMLDQVADRVTTMIAAPEGWSERFDAYGCIKTESWLEQHLPIEDNRVRFVAGPGEQAYAVAEELSRYRGKFRCDQITIGLGDEKIAPQIARQLSEFNVATRSVALRQVEDSLPYLLLQAASEYLGVPRFSAFAALVRHPDVYDWLMHHGSGPALLAKLDEYYLKRLPTEFAHIDEAMQKDWPIVAAALAMVANWLKALHGKDRPLAQWMEPLQTLLTDVYRHREFKIREAADHATWEACQALQTAIAALGEVPEKLAPSCAATSAIELVLEAAGQQQIAPPADERAIEMLGWFELPLDDAPALIVTTFNEGFIPGSQGADMFLPNRLREHLGLNHSDRLWARDAYAASLLLATREDVTWIVARHDVDRNPLAPSRLLFSADRETIAQRACKFFDEKQCDQRAKLLLGGAFSPLPVSRLEVPSPERLRDLKIEWLRVTDFRTYLDCPYRFYLRRVLKLEALADAAEELDAMQFGNLLHHVLQGFGNDRDATRITDPQVLSDWLADALYTEAQATLGSLRRPVVNVQIEQLRFRLNAFATWQAKRASEGWEIFGVEKDLGQELTFGPHTIRVEGRVDRIDVHPDRKLWTVFDYKSGDGGYAPERTHLRRDAWIDLQLPLYRRMAQIIDGMNGPPQVGYIVLPKQSDKAGDRIAEWPEGRWKSADETANAVVAGILGRHFWPPNYEHRVWEDELSAVCQDFVSGRRLGEPHASACGPGEPHASACGLQEGAAS